MSINNIFQFLVPKDKKFFPLFEQASSNLVLLAETLHEAVNAPKSEREDYFRKIEELDIEGRIHSGVLKDEIIEVNAKKDKEISSLKLRKVTFYDRESKREFEFLTNLFELRADLIAGLYKIRWQIELVFKQLKQNFPLRYFLGDNENAIKIQIYCVLIVNLLLAVIQKKLKRSWAFSNLVSFCKIHLFNYIQLMKFLENPEKD